MLFENKTTFDYFSSNYTSWIKLLFHFLDYREVWKKSLKLLQKFLTQNRQALSSHGLAEKTVQYFMFFCRWLFSSLRHRLQINFP